MNKNNECVIYTFTKVFSWDNKNKIISVKRSFQTFDLHDGGALGSPRSRKNIIHKNPLIISVSLRRKKVSLIKENYIDTVMDGRDCLNRNIQLFGKYIILPLIKYPEIKVVLKDIDVKNGFFNIWMY